MTKIENKYSKKEQFYFTIEKITPMIDFGVKMKNQKWRQIARTFVRGI